MSSEIYELMKRSDEAAVVEKAHLQPRFVEDVVREMVRRVAEAYPELRDGGFLLARQENLETIHRHSVVAERSGDLAEILDRARDGRALPPPRHQARVARGALRRLAAAPARQTRLGSARSAHGRGRRPPPALVVLLARNVRRSRRSSRRR